MSKLKSPEERIFDAAKEEFTEKGFAGTKKQAIADRAGISKAALHYYFRSKEKLFKKVVHYTANLVFSTVKAKINEDLPFEEKISFVIDLYIDTLIKHQDIAFFFFSELMKHPNVLEDIISDQNKLEELSQAYNAEVAKGTVKKIDTRHLIINVVSLCIYPVLGKPLISRILNIPSKEYNKFLKERKIVVKEFILNALRP